MMSSDDITQMMKPESHVNEDEEERKWLKENGWVRCKIQTEDSDESQSYFYHRSTNISQWESPFFSSTRYAESYADYNDYNLPATEDILAEDYDAKEWLKENNWVSYSIQIDGTNYFQPYYYNTLTEESTWANPYYSVSGCGIMDADSAYTNYANVEVERIYRPPIINEDDEVDSNKALFVNHDSGSVVFTKESDATGWGINIDVVTGSNQILLQPFVGGDCVEIIDPHSNSYVEELTRSHCIAAEVVVTDPPLSISPVSFSSAASESAVSVRSKNKKRGAGGGMHTTVVTVSADGSAAVISGKPSASTSAQSASSLSLSVTNSVSPANDFATFASSSKSDAEVESEKQYNSILEQHRLPSHVAQDSIRPAEVGATFMYPSSTIILQPPDLYPSYSEPDAVASPRSIYGLDGNDSLSDLSCSDSASVALSSVTSTPSQRIRYMQIWERFFENAARHKLSLEAQTLHGGGSDDGMSARGSELDESNINEARRSAKSSRAAAAIQRLASLSGLAFNAAVVSSAEGSKRVKRPNSAKPGLDSWPRPLSQRAYEGMMKVAIKHISRRPRDGSATPRDSASHAALGRALLAACASGDVFSVEMLLSAGAPVNFPDSYNRCAAHYASRFDHAAVLHVLFDHGADLEACDKCGRTAVHIAAEFVASNALKCLLECAADSNTQDFDGNTALHLCALPLAGDGDGVSETNALACVSLLLQYDASVTVQNVNGKDAYTLVMSMQSHTKSVKHLSAIFYQYKAADDRNRPSYSSDSSVADADGDENENRELSGGMKRHSPSAVFSSFMSNSSESNPSPSPRSSPRSSPSPPAANKLNSIATKRPPLAFDRLGKPPLAPSFTVSRFPAGADSIASASLPLSSSSTVPWSHLSVNTKPLGSSFGSDYGGGDKSGGLLLSAVLDIETMAERVALEKEREKRGLQPMASTPGSQIHALRRSPRMLSPRLPVEAAIEEEEEEDEEGSDEDDEDDENNLGSIVSNAVWGVAVSMIDASLSMLSDSQLNDGRRNGHLAPGEQRSYRHATSRVGPVASDSLPHEDSDDDLHKEATVGTNRSLWGSISSLLTPRSTARLQTQGSIARPRTFAPSSSQSYTDGDAPPTDSELIKMGMIPLRIAPPASVATDLSVQLDSIRSGLTPRRAGADLRPPDEVRQALAAHAAGTPLSMRSSRQQQFQRISDPFQIRKDVHTGGDSKAAAAAEPKSDNVYSLGAIPHGVNWRYVDIFNNPDSLK